MTCLEKQLSVTSHYSKFIWTEKHGSNRPQVLICGAFPQEYKPRLQQKGAKKLTWCTNDLWMLYSLSACLKNETKQANYCLQIRHGLSI